MKWEKWGIAGKIILTKHFDQKGDKDMNVEDKSVSYLFPLCP